MYWASKHSAEVDFVIVKEGEVIPIEVKSLINTKSKIFTVQVSSYEPLCTIRVSPEDYGFENGIKTIS